MALHNCNVG
jgi:hypothetical protein